MIPYSVTPDKKSAVHFVLAGSAIGIIVAAREIISVIIGALPEKFENLGDYVGFISVFAIYAVLLWLFDNYIWRWSYIRYWHRIPDINGKWTGVIKRTDNAGQKDEHAIYAIIRQTWSSIEIDITGRSTKSRALSASFALKDGHYADIIYSYRADPIAIHKDHNLYGEGMQHLELTLIDSKPILAGRYFSSKLRGGYVEFCRQEPT